MKNKSIYLFLFPLSFLLGSCQTKPPKELNKINENSAKLNEIDQKLIDLQMKTSRLQQENEEANKTISSLENEVQSQNEMILSQKKNISILKRGMRSGLFEELPEDAQDEPLKNDKTSPLPNLTNGRSGLTEDLHLGKEDVPTKSEGRDYPIGPKELLASAEIKIRESHFKEGILQIDELKKKFPNFDDNGRSFLLAAEGWLKLKDYNNVLSEIHSFYLKYPENADLTYAKLLEGQSNEGLGRYESAASLYGEVISLSPQSAYAAKARNGMLRMRDQK